MNVEIGAEAALFPEKEYINGIVVTVRHDSPWDVLERIFFTAVRNAVVQVSK